MAFPHFQDEDPSLSYDEMIAKFRRDSYAERDPCVRIIQYEQLILNLQEQKREFY